MKQSAKRLISMVVSLVLMIGAFVIFFNLTQPIYQDIQSAKGIQASKQSFIDSKKAAIKQVQKLIQSFGNDTELQSIQNAVQISLPDNPDITGALTQISGLANLNNTSNISIQSINIADIPASQSQPSGSSAKKQNIFDKPFSKINFTLQISGLYDDFKNYLRKIETNTRIFDVKEIDVNPQVKLGSVIYTYSLQVAAYYQTLPQTQKVAITEIQP